MTTKFHIGQIVKATGGRLGNEIIDVEVYDVCKTTLRVHYQKSNKFGTFDYGNATVRLDGRGAHLVD